MTDARPHVVLVVTGSVAAYKAVQVARLLLKAGVRVTPVLSLAGEQFVGKATLGALTGEPVHQAMFDPMRGGELHVELGRSAALVLFAPATADLLARMATGRADDLAAAIALCTQAPLLIAPAMHPRMWAHPRTQANVATLDSASSAGQGPPVHWVGPVDGEVASGETGLGRLAEPEIIVARALELLNMEAGPSLRRRDQDLAGLRLLITAGPTCEDIDPVRFLSNRSTGKMGFALAAVAAERGAVVQLVTGPVALVTPPGVIRYDVRTALEMQQQIQQCVGADLQGADAVVMAAAVSDYRLAQTSPTKLKRVAEPGNLSLVANPDIIASLGAQRAALGATFSVGSAKRRAPVLVAFAVETLAGAALLAEGRRKLANKQVDLVVCNTAADGFGGNDNHAVLVGPVEHDERDLGPMTKHRLADHILHAVRGLVSPQENP